MRESLQEIWQYRPLILELVRRDLKVRYKNSVGGVLWSLFNPLMQIVVITITMKFILQNPVKDYSAYLFVVYLWTFFYNALMDGAVSVLANAHLVRKIYFPRAILPLTSLLGSTFHFSIAFVFTILYFFYLGTYPTQLRPYVLLVVPVVFFLMVFTLGISYVTAYLNVFYEDVRFLLQALLGLVFYGVPILYPIERVAAHPNPLLFHVYMLNPVSAFLVTYQRALLGPPTVKDALGNNLPRVDVQHVLPYFFIACALSLVLLVVGFLLFERYKWDIAERL